MIKVFNPKKQYLKLKKPILGKLKKVLEKGDYILGDEVKNIGPGDLVHIPRNVAHTVRAVNGPARFFTAKHPVGNGELSQDYNLAPNADELKVKLAG